MPQDVDIYNWTAYADGLYYSNDQDASSDPALTSGYLMFRRSMNVTDDGQTSVNVVVDRVIEPQTTCSGTASCTITITDYINSKVRVSYGGTLSWADGELGPKVASLTLVPSGTTAYTGAELYNLSLTSVTGATIHAWDTTYPSSGTEQRWLEYNAYLKISSATLATGATYCDDATATDYTTPAGTVGDPKKLLTACYEATAGDVIYMRAGTYSETGTPDSRGIGTETDTHGTIIPKNSGTVNNGIWLLPYPSEVVVIDANDNTGATSGGGYYGCIVTRGVNYWMFDGDGTTTATDGQRSGIQLADTSEYNIIHDWTISFIDGTSGQNIGGTVFKSAFNNVISNNTITDVREAGNTQITGGHKNNACIYMERHYGNVIENNNINTSNNGIYNKFVPDADYPEDIVRGNIFHNVGTAIFWAKNAGGGNTTPRMLYPLVYENLLYDITFRAFATDVSSLEDSGHEWIWNNTIELDSTSETVSEETLLSLRGSQESLVWNNLFVNDNTNSSTNNYNDASIATTLVTGRTVDPTDTPNNTKIRYLDYNGYIENIKMTRLYNGTTLLTLANVAALDGTDVVIHEDVGVGEIEANAIESTKALTFTDVSTNDWSLVSGTSPALDVGLNGENLGCYADDYSTVGVQ